ncbi:MAG TPA: exonuclease SbcCD subunit D [Chloroflexota bacterium]
MAVRILHTADLHLGRSFPHLGDAGVARQKDLFDTFERICSEALENEVAALLIAGDLFDTFSPSGDVVGRVQGHLERLAGAGVEVFIVPGDADSAAYERSVWRREEFVGAHVFRSPIFETQSFEAGGTTLHVHGIAFDRAASAEPLNTLRPAGPGVHIGLLHATLDGRGAPMGAEHYFPVGSAELLASGMTYVALGHNHTRQQLPPRGAISACYPGSPEGLDATETGPRYVALLEFDDGPPEVSFLQVNRREVVNAEVDTTGCGAEEVLEKLLALAGDDVVLTAHLTGSSDEMLDPHDLTRMIDDSFFWVEVQDETTLSSSPFAAAVAGENTIRGHFVGTLQRRINGTGDAQERAALERALKLGLQALQRSSAA